MLLPVVWQVWAEQSVLMSWPDPNSPQKWIERPTPYTHTLQIHALQCVGSSRKQMACSGGHSGKVKDGVCMKG